MPTRKHITPGDRFHRLIIVKELGRYLDKSGISNRRFLCQCDCGNELSVILKNLTSGNTRSCGCLFREVMVARNYRHGGSNDRLYDIWSRMKGRCENPKTERYSCYGGRGISVCQSWVESYAVFREWAIRNGYIEGLTIERKNVNGNYCPENCTFIPMSEQASNTRKNVFLTAFGETKTISQWARDSRCVASVSRLSYRVKKGWDHFSAITRPPDITITQFKKRN